MTSIVGIRCHDGIVIGADSSATLASGQFRTVEQPYEKLEIVGDRVIIAGTGQIGLDQRFCAIVQKAWNDKIFQNTAIEVAKLLCKLTHEDFLQTHVNINRGQYGALLAFPAEGKQHLCEFSIDDFQPELKTERLWYASMGSAQTITDSFLAFIREIYWNESLPNIHEATFVATWTIDHAIKINPGGVNGPIRIAVLEKDKKGDFQAHKLSDEELGEHRQNIEGAKEMLRGYKLKHKPTDQSDVLPPLKT